MPSRDDAEVALFHLLEAFGVQGTQARRQTARRVARLWRQELLKGQGVDLGSILAKSVVSPANEPVLLTNVGVHLVCPHHLTVAFGQAHLAYLPSDRIASLGALGDLIAACTSRLVLQEEATTQVAGALTSHLGARAAVACIDALHPCHNLTRPRSHGARAVTWARAGRKPAAGRLERLLTASLRPAASSRPASKKGR